MVPIHLDTWHKSSVTYYGYRMAYGIEEMICDWNVKPILQSGCFTSRLHWRDIKGPLPRHPRLDLSATASIYPGGVMAEVMKHGDTPLRPWVESIWPDQSRRPNNTHARISLPGAAVFNPGGVFDTLGSKDEPPPPPTTPPLSRPAPPPIPDGTVASSPRSMWQFHFANEDCVVQLVEDLQQMQLAKEQLELDLGVSRSESSALESRVAALSQGVQHLV